MPDRIVKGKLRAGTKAFVFQGRVKGSAKEIRTTLGRCDEMSPDQARAKVDQLRSSLTDGVDPIAAKREAVQKIAEDADRARLEGVTLRQVMQHYIEKKKTRHGPLKPKSVADIKRHVDKSFAEWADMPVQDITREMCETRFDHLSKFGLLGKRPAPVQAVQAFTILRALMNWAYEKFRVGGKPIISENPVHALKGTMHPPKVRKSYIPLDRIGAVANMLQKWSTDQAVYEHDRTCADLVAFLLFTGCRRGEAEQLTWDRVKLEEDAGTWHLPNPKNSNPVTFPLSAPARALLADRKKIKGNPYVFPGRTRGQHIVDARPTMERVSELAGLHLSPHDLRRSFMAVAIKCGIELWKFEMLTNHVNKQSVTLASYVEKNDLRYLAPEIESIGAWIVQAAAASSSKIMKLRA